MILSERFGENLASEMMFTAKSYTGEELKNSGASITFRKRENVLQEALNIAKSLAQKSLVSLKVLKKELASRRLERLQSVIKREVKMHEQTFNSPEVKDNIGYFYTRSQTQQTSAQEQQTSPVQQVKTPPKHSGSAVRTAEIRKN